MLLLAPRGPRQITERLRVTLPISPADRPRDDDPARGLLGTTLVLRATSPAPRIALPMPAHSSSFWSWPR